MVRQNPGPTLVGMRLLFADPVKSRSALRSRVKEPIVLRSRANSFPKRSALQSRAKEPIVSYESALRSRAKAVESRLFPGCFLVNPVFHSIHQVVHYALKRTPVIISQITSKPAQFSNSKRDVRPRCTRKIHE
jgi:hypothetical protein